MIFTYGNLLNLGSDDINYLKSAVALIKNGILTYHNYNEPTVFIMPLYPIFLSFIFRIFGYGFAGLQAARIIQAVISCFTIVYIFGITSKLFDMRAGVISAFLVAFYLPNITTAGYFLTETVFTFLLCALIYHSVKAAGKLNAVSIIHIGVLWAAATLCRPTIAFYPLFFFLYLFLYHGTNFCSILKWAAIMSVVFCVAMSPWWIRNYREYGVFIPLTASGGNPMLQGTYVNYVQTSENVVYYKLGKNAYETNKNEVEAAKQRIKSELKKDFWGYLGWYTLGKTFYLWCSPFYWKSIFNIHWSYVFVFHYIILTGLVGMMIIIFKHFHIHAKTNIRKGLVGNEAFRYFLPASIILYFNFIHCIYMAFDRYAFPLMPLVSIFTGYLISRALPGLKTLAGFLFSGR